MGRHVSQISWKQLGTHSLITVEPGYGVRGSIDRAAAQAGVELRIAHEVSLLGTALAMAASGLGVSCCRRRSSRMRDTRTWWRGG